MTNSKAWEGVARVSHVCISRCDYNHSLPPLQLVAAMIAIAAMAMRSEGQRQRLFLRRRRRRARTTTPALDGASILDGEDLLSVLVQRCRSFRSQIT